ncbi:patatin-like phospholipase family protein [Kitasatospora sp. NPDC059599]|uniref:patatin-like phospholipase family protein n=1 Tax=Kitasatospora sp. NPDC059599 TaxID=3346880 RepID=UPI0036D0BA7C
MSAAGSPLRVAAVDHRSGHRVVFGDPDAPAVAVADAGMASRAIPGRSAPVRLNGSAYVDGGCWSATNAPPATPSPATPPPAATPLHPAPPGRGLAADAARHPGPPDRQSRTAASRAEQRAVFRPGHHRGTPAPTGPAPPRQHRRPPSRRHHTRERATPPSGTGTASRSTGTGKPP